MCVELLLFRGTLARFSEGRLPPEPWSPKDIVRERHQNEPATIAQNEDIAFMSLGLRRAA